MLWLFIIGFLCGLYEILMGSIGVFIIDMMDLGEWFGLECIPGIKGKAVWDEPKEAPGELFAVLHTVIIIMYSTI